MMTEAFWTTEAFWWYLLAGFFIGFSISTLWEWLYFRRRRMAIRDRRVAELEAALRTYAAAASAPAVNSAATEDWGDPQFTSPHVYLETEEPAPPSADPPDTLPPNRAPSAHDAALVTTSATTTFAPPDPKLSQPATAPESPANVPFRSVAVPPTAAAMSQPAAAVPQPAAAVPQPAEQLSSPRVQPAQAAAVTGAAIAAHHIVPASEQAAAAAEAESFTYRRPVSVAYANGHEGPHNPEPSPPATRAAATATTVTAATVTAATVTGAAAAEERSITSSDLDALAASINELIATLNKAPAEPAQPIMLERTSPPAPTQAEFARPMGRIERMLVRLVQAMAQFARQVRAIVSGQDAPAPARSAPPPTADDLTRIDGLTAEHAERLRVAGVTTFARLAALSPDELRLLTLTPGGAAVDVERWRAQAASLAAAGAERVPS